MAYRIISPPYSFVRFSDRHVGDPSWAEKNQPGRELGMLFPVCVETDYAYQWVIETDTPEEADDACLYDSGPGGGPSIIAIPGTSLTETLTKAEWDLLTSSGGDSSNIIADLGGGRYRLDSHHVLYYVPKMPTLENIQCGQCFQLLFAISNIADVGFFSSNIFSYQCENTDYTTVIDYYSEVDEAGFYYCVSPLIKNRARLPIYLTRPTLPDEEESYRLSSGAYRLRKSVVRKLYEVVTDALPFWVAECLRAVFIHETVFMEDDDAMPQAMWYKGEVAKEGTYEPQYLEFMNYPLAPVKLKVVAVDFDLRKNNCGGCGDYTGLITTTDPAVFAMANNAAYTFDLLTLVDAPCCDPLVFTLISWDATRLTSIPILDQAPGVFATLAFIMKGSLAATATVELAKVKVSCGADEGFISIKAFKL